jgi:hypothetical protein
MSYLDVAEFVDNDIVKAGKWHPDQVETEGNTFGLVGITSPTCFHRADGDGRQWDLYYGVVDHASSRQNILRSTYMANSVREYFQVKCNGSDIRNGEGG